MEGVEDASICSVPETVGLRIRSVTNKNAELGMAVDFQIVCLDKGKCVAANFAKVGKGWDVASLYLIRSFLI